MRRTYVHTATLDLGSAGDPAAPGGAVTLELCGHWEHAGACDWPHHTAVEPLAPDRLAVRTVFVCGADAEPAVRDRIGQGCELGN